MQPFAQVPKEVSERRPWNERVLTVVQKALSLRVQVPNNHIRTPNLYCNYYYPNPKYLIIGYMDHLGLFMEKTFPKWPSSASLAGRQPRVFQLDLPVPGLDLVVHNGESNSKP